MAELPDCLLSVIAKDVVTKQKQFVFSGRASSCGSQFYHQHIRIKTTFPLKSFWKKYMRKLWLLAVVPLAFVGYFFWTSASVGGLTPVKLTSAKVPPAEILQMSAQNGDEAAQQTSATNLPPPMLRAPQVVSFVAQERQLAMQKKYGCGKTLRFLEQSEKAHYRDEKNIARYKAILSEECSGLDLSSKSIYEDLKSVARTGDLAAIHRFATAPPLMDSDPKVQNALIDDFVAELPALLSKGVALNDPISMRLSAEYFMSCRIRIVGVPLFARNRNYRTDGPEALRLLRMARGISGEDKDSRYAEFERLLDSASRGLQFVSTCPATRV